jgi:hypothetical protein
MFSRALALPARPTASFFLCGPRQTGKSTLLRDTYPDATWIDLLRTDVFIRYRTHPALLREEGHDAPKSRIVVIDEVQKVPALLDEVHWLIENLGLCIALCGSSARSVKRGHANLFGGRALRYELLGLVSAKLGSERQLEGGDRRGGWMIENAGADFFSFSSDYPHPEGGRDPLGRFEASLASISDDAKERFYAQNFAARMGS